MGVSRQIHAVATPSSQVGTLREYITESNQTLCKGRKFSFGPQAQCSDTLIVTAPAGVHLSANRTSDLSNTTLDRRVDVFFASNKLKGSIYEFRSNLVQCGFNLCNFGKWQNSGVTKTFHMRERTNDVVFPQAFVERQAFSERQEFFCWPTTKSAMPQWL